ncbi:hypothetical protein KC219_23810, partial [Mycobacterium tuberculosis]|nr:hypothetical protein [Mycobacterium tuberculosis]
PLSRMVAVPDPDGLSDTMVAAVNGPPVAPSVRFTVTGVPALVVTEWAAATGSGLTVSVIVAGSDVPNTLLSV